MKQSDFTAIKAANDNPLVVLAVGDLFDGPLASLQSANRLPPKGSVKFQKRRAQP